MFFIKIYILKLYTFFSTYFEKIFLLQKQIHSKFLLTGYERLKIKNNSSLNKEDIFEKTIEDNKYFHRNIIKKNSINYLLQFIFIQNEIFQYISKVTGYNFSIDFILAYTTLNIEEENKQKAIYANHWHRDKPYSKNTLKLIMPVSTINNNCGPMEILSESIGMSPARAARPPRASSASPRDSDVFIRETESAVARRNRPRSDSISSNYNTGNVTENFGPPRTPAPRTPALNTEERRFLERTLRNNGLDPNHLSPVRQDVLRGGFSSSSPRRPAVIISQTPQTSRLSGIQQHDGVSTRSIRAETGEPHTQYQTPARGRPRIRPFGPQTQPNRRGRPSNAELATRAQEQLQASPQLHTPKLRLPKKK
jgi:hypothetical protein